MSFAATIALGIIGDELIEYVKQRATDAGWPIPHTPEELMAWFIDELEIQKDRLADHNETDRLPFIYDLQRAVAYLDIAGVRPAPMPWNAPILVVQIADTLDYDLRGETLREHLTHKAEGIAVQKGISMIGRMVRIQIRKNSELAVFIVEEPD